jgi:hypothetical protein
VGACDIAGSGSCGGWEFNHLGTIQQFGSEIGLGDHCSLTKVKGRINYAVIVVEFLEAGIGTIGLR